PDGRIIGPAIGAAAEPRRGLIVSAGLERQARPREPDPVVFGGQPGRVLDLGANLLHQGWRAVGAPVIAEGVDRVGRIPPAVLDEAANVLAAPFPEIQLRKRAPHLVAERVEARTALE